DVFVSLQHFFSGNDDPGTPVDAARGSSATAMNSNDAACGALDQLRGMIRKRDKRIGGFGHEQVLQNNIACGRDMTLPRRRGYWPDGRGRRGKLGGSAPMSANIPTKNNRLILVESSGEPALSNVIRGSNGSAT